MKRFLALAVLASTIALAQTPSPVNGNTKNKLEWTPNPVTEEVDSYNIHVATGIGEVKALNSISVVVPLTTVFGGLQNGQYTVTVTAVGASGLESDPSLPLVVQWKGNKPSKPTGLKIIP